jgi:adenylate cyclase
MGMQFQTWLVFGLSFLASASLLGFMFITRVEVQYLIDWMRADLPPEQPAEGSAPAASGESPVSWADYEVDVDAQDDEEEEEGEDDDEGEEEYDEDEDEEDEEDEASDQDVRIARKSLMTFLEQALAGMVKGGFKLDSIKKFGCQLFLAGACEAIARNHALSHDQFVELLSKCVSVLGFPQSVAVTFGQKYEEYLLDPRYAAMFQAGAGAIEGGARSPADDLATALKQWSNPRKGGEDPDALVAVLFTDIVGSTRMNQLHGDAAAQRVVHDHNSIVRPAIQNAGGTEVKHTGDGIMASFTSSAKAVEAAVEMIRRVNFRNGQNPEVPLHMRIGINAGQPIAENGDLFGTTVQIAARLCDKAKRDGVCVSNVVRELCAGKNFKFESMGEAELKGVEEPTKIYNVVIPS